MMINSEVLASHETAHRVLDEVVVPFYAVLRDMTVPPDFIRDENDAEHSWALATFACSLVDRIDPGLDKGLVAQFSLVHDLTEIGAGDTSVWAQAEELSTKEDREAQALEELKARFPDDPWLHQTIEDYERQDTNEARYVKAIDKYLALIMRLKDGGKYYRDHKITKEIFDKNLQAHREKAHLHPGVGLLYEQARGEFEKHPEFFFEEI